MSGTETLLQMRHIEKFYGRVHALRDVNLTIRKGEIVGLLGDNGAGKSTLIKVLSGAVPYTSGQIFIKGREVRLRSTNDAIASGIETIYHRLRPGPASFHCPQSAFLDGSSEQAPASSTGWIRSG